MIVGLGHDIVDLQRFEAVLSRRGERFLKRVFSAEERAYCQGRHAPALHFAARFAAKEAFYKAVSGGVPLRLGFQDAAVTRHSDGRLDLALSARSEQAMRAAGGEQLHLTLSHDGNYASAVVIIEALPQPLPPSKRSSS